MALYRRRDAATDGSSDGSDRDASTGPEYHGADERSRQPNCHRDKFVFDSLERFVRRQLSVLFDREGSKMGVL